MNTYSQHTPHHKLKWSAMLGVASLMALIAGLTNAGGDLFSGLIRGLSGVFFGLAFVALVIEKAEAQEH